MSVYITVFHEYLAGIIFSEFVILEISRVFNLAIPKKKKKKKKKGLFCCSLAYTPAYTHPAIAKYSAMYIVFKIQYYTVYFCSMQRDPGPCSCVFWIIPPPPKIFYQMRDTVYDLRPV